MGWTATSRGVSSSAVNWAPFLDPMADKLLLVSGLVVLSFSSDHLPQLPVWMIGVVFGRDLFLLLGFFVITHWCGKMKIQPHFISKCATVLQMFVVAWGVLGGKISLASSTTGCFGGASRRRCAPVRHS